MDAASPNWVILNSIRLIVQDLREASRAAEARFGLGAAQLFVLQTLAIAPGVSVNELAARTYTHQSSVSAVVKKLVGRKLVRARPSPQDARRLRLTLTASGLKVVRRAPDAIQMKLISGLNGLPEVELERLAHSMRRLVRAMGAQGRKATMFLEDPPAGRAEVRGKPRGKER
jgi:DNA-binding MarR family transcriptional regulator